MNVDFRLLRRSALAVCGTALLGFTVGGCVSTHKPRFWDQDDVKATTGTSGSPSATTPPPAAASTTPASTVVAADHASADDPIGHASAPDFADSTPSPAGTQTGIPSDSQVAPQTKSTASSDAVIPAGPQNAGSDVWGDKLPAAPPAKQTGAPLKASDPFVDTAAPPAPPAPPAVNVSTTAVTASPSKGASSANPFAEGENPVFAEKSQTQPAGLPPQQAMPDPLGSLPQPAAPPEAAAQVQSTSVQSQSASAEPIASSQPAPIADAAPLPSVAPADAQPAPTVAAAETRKNAVDPFADPSATVAPATPPAAVHAAEDKPSCAAPAPNQNYATGGSTPAPSDHSTDGNPAASAALVPARAPASTEQVTDLVVPASDPQAGQIVIPPAKTAVRGVGSKPSVAKASEPAAEPSASEESQWTHAASQEADATVKDSMILDSNSVRGRFTGTEHATGGPRHLLPAEEAPHIPVPQTIQQSVASPVHDAPSPPQPVVPKQAEPLSRSDAKDPFATPSPASGAAGQTAHQPPAKSPSGVVNAIAQQDGPPPAADPFALEQTVDTSLADPIHANTAQSAAKTDAPQAFDPFDAPSTLATGEVLVADSVGAPTVSHFGWRIHSETWFAFGLAAGLIASLVLWLRSRPKNNHAVNG